MSILEGELDLGGVASGVGGGGGGLILGVAGGGASEQAGGVAVGIVEAASV